MKMEVYRWGQMFFLLIGVLGWIEVVSHNSGFLFLALLGNSMLIGHMIVEIHTDD